MKYRILTIKRDGVSAERDCETCGSIQYLCKDENNMNVYVCQSCPEIYVSFNQD
jgi:hypothetical protein